MSRATTPGYTATHHWVNRHFGSPQKCECCGTETAKCFDWANLSGQYKRERSDWKRLCRKCHHAHDRTGWEPPNTRMIAHNGKTMSVIDWARHAGLKYTTLYRRIHAYGWDMERALTTATKRAKQ